MARKRRKSIMFNNDNRDHQNINARSQAYQWKILEIPWDFTPPPQPDLNTSGFQFSNADTLAARLDPYEYNERLLDLKDELLARFWKLAKDVLTPLQLTVLTMYTDGYTQTAIAKHLGRNQTSVHKSIHGNAYGDGNSYYGGAMKKLKKAVQGDSVMQEIVEQMKELRQEKL